MIASMHVLDIIVIALGALILFLLLYIVAAVNSFKRLLVKIANADDKVEECLKNRYDLFKTLKITQDNSFDALDFKNMTIEQKIEINRKLNSISENLNKIQLDSLKENESQLQAAILEYNSQVEKFNHRLTVFPASLIANLIRLKPIKYFEN
ncbi:MAG TPA: LemA family protein [Clostridia bacterium]